MSKQGVNKVIILGNVGQDPEVKYMSTGDCVVNLSIATGESWKDKTGQKQERTEWHRIVAYRKLAEIIGQYVKKGSKLYIEGKLQTRKWKAQDGSDRYTTEIIADEMQMLDSKPQGDYVQSQADYQAKQKEPEPAGGSAPDFDDDIPF